MLLPSGDTHKCLCGKWWLKTDYKRGNRTHENCPACRFDRTKKTQYWLGESSPLANHAHEWPPSTKDLPPLTPSPNGLPPIKRQRADDGESEPARSRKMSKVHGLPSPVTPSTNSRLPSQNRNNSTASSTSLKSEPYNLETNATRILKILADCEYNPIKHKAQELTAVRRRKSISTTSIVDLETQKPPITFRVQETSSRYSGLGEWFEKITVVKGMDLLSTEEKADFMARAQRPVQRAFNDRERAKAEVERLEGMIEQEGKIVAETSIVEEGIEKQRRILEEWVNLTLKVEF